MRDTIYICDWCHRVATEYDILEWSSIQVKRGRDDKTYDICPRCRALGEKLIDRYNQAIGARGEKTTAAERNLLETVEDLKYVRAERGNRNGD